MASLAITIPPERSSMEEYLSYDSIAYDKKRKLSSLLSLINIPTRKSLIQDVVSELQCSSILCFLLLEIFILFYLEFKKNKLSM